MCAAGIRGVNVPFAFTGVLKSVLAHEVLCRWSGSRPEALWWRELYSSVVFLVPCF